MRRRAILFAAAIFGGSSAWAAPHSKAGAFGGAVLSQFVSPAQAAMGGARAALAGDANASVGNPAGLASVRSVELLFAHRALFEGANFSYAGVVVPLTGATSSNVGGLGSFGFSGGFLDYGGLIGRDAAGARSADFDADDRAFALSYGKSLFRGLALGARVKNYRQTIADRSADGFAYDLGFRFEPAGARWAVGAFMTDLGDGPQFDADEARLPRAVEAGVAVRPYGERLTLAFDAFEARDTHLEARAGAEFWLSDVFALRAGYDSSFDLGNGLAAGVSVQVRNLEAFFFPVKRFRIDYAFVSAGRLADEGSSGAPGLHNVSLSFQFGEDGHVSR